MVVVYLDKNTRKCFPYSRLRTSNNAYLPALNLEEPAMQKLMDNVPATEPVVVSPVGTTEPPNTGNGINTFGRGINIMGKGAIVPVCAVQPEVLQLDHLVVRGNGIYSDFKKAGNKVFAWTKKNVMPLLRDVGKQALQSGKRVGAEVLAETAPHLATLGAQAIDKKYGNSTIGNIAQQGLAQLGKTAQKTASDYVSAQQKTKPYTGLENKGAEAIKRLSLQRLQAEMAKQQPAPAKKGRGTPQTGLYTQDHVNL